MKIKLENQARREILKSKNKARQAIDLLGGIIGHIALNDKLTYTEFIRHYRDKWYEIVE